MESASKKSSSRSPSLDYIPPKPGVYKFKDHVGTIIYVGASKNLKSRVSTYFTSASHKAHTQLLDSIHDVEVEVISSINEAFLRERELIRLHRPRYNVRWLDDKSYPFLRVSVEDAFPRIGIVRQEKVDGSLYFERQTTIGPLKESIKHVRKIFPLCDCQRPVEPSKKKRPCLNYFIGLCPAPCAGKITKKDYRENVDNFILFLEGKSEDLLNNWRAQMVLHAQNLEFEEAARVRDRISAIENLSAPTEESERSLIDAVGIVHSGPFIALVILSITHGKVAEKAEYLLENPDYVFEDDLLVSGLKEHYASRNAYPSILLVPSKINDLDFLFDWLNTEDKPGTKIQYFSNVQDNKHLKTANRAAEQAINRHTSGKISVNPNYSEIEVDLQRLIGVDKPVRLIECIDISTLQGTNTVGSVVAFKDGMPYKTYYRRYRIKTIQGKTDDPGSMREVLTRHFNRKLKDKLDYPDLLLVDGGVSQLSAVGGVIRSLNLPIPFIGIAKKEEELVIPGKKNRIKLQHTSKVLRLMVALRDEAHRFAITYHRKRREATSYHSDIDQIRGIGPKKRKYLVEHFGSMSAVQSATVEELQLVRGITEADARNIWAYFHTGTFYLKK